ncbi:uncharacterized protein APUU_21275A [Aspergillus puulaauensis]|uniref:Uncharacterized protein n=1 Tax=Aspergillus puulaauensis TaxID=1220207 RepID=A0A7R8AKT9_9EURO|nr:uncharacterized protein APUU_21275A [Aspergillus puulaauensis]BCS20843.1 hypothetical protein APUU_21275A [Aspergillus puulaauensis]
MSQVTQPDRLVPLPHMSGDLKRYKDWSMGFDDDTRYRIKQTIRGGSDALRGEFGIIVAAVSRRLERYLKPRGILGPCLDIEAMEFLAFVFRSGYDSLESAWEDVYTKDGAVYDSTHNLAQL